MLRTREIIHYLCTRDNFHYHSFIRRQYNIIHYWFVLFLQFKRTVGWISKLCTKLPIFADHFCQFFSSLHAQARITWEYFSTKIWNCVQSALVCSAVNLSYIILYKIFLSSKQEAQRYFIFVKSISRKFPTTRRPNIIYILKTEWSSGLPL